MATGGTAGSASGAGTGGAGTPEACAEYSAKSDAFAACDVLSDSCPRDVDALLMAIADADAFDAYEVFESEGLREVKSLDSYAGSSSFVLHCAGLSLLFLSLFYLVIDVWRFRAWSMILVVIGSNSVLIYMARRFIDFDYTASFFFDGVLRHTGAYQPLLFEVAVVFVEWLLLLFLFRKRIFLRV